MGKLHSQYTYDNNLLAKAAGLVAASADVATILDLGAGFVAADMVVDVSAIELDTADEKYDILVLGSNSPTFASGVVQLARQTLGKATAPVTLDTGVGRFPIPFHNELNGTQYRYVRLRTVVAGTIVSGINYTAFIGMCPIC
jgi:dihydroxyacetone kinase DhaKLM complex PTS-EIIA-like component DhaM